MAKKVVKDGINISNEIKYKDINGNFLDRVPGEKWRIEVEGVFGGMSDKGFNKKQLEQLQGLLNPIVQDIKDIKSRLDVLESFHKNDFDKLKSKNKK